MLQGNSGKGGFVDVTLSRRPAGSVPRVPTRKGEAGSFWATGYFPIGDNFDVLWVLFHQNHECQSQHPVYNRFWGKDCTSSVCLSQR